MKKNEFGDVDTFKARLVAQGFKNSLKLDWFDTFSPVIRRETFRIILALSVLHNWTVHHLDVTSAYLNSEISKEVFVEQPHLFEEPGKQRANFVNFLKVSMGYQILAKIGTIG